jgi:hypothetical protein
MVPLVVCPYSLSLSLSLARSLSPQRMGTAEEAAGGILMLASPWATYVNGVAFSKSVSIVALWSKCTRPLTFENFCQVIHLKSLAAWASDVS